MRTLILSILTIIISLLILSIPSQGTEDRATQCNYCHSNLGVIVDDPECEYCHTVVRNPVEHQSSICKNCHSITDTSSYHTVHSNSTCITCHQTGKLPPKTYDNCLSCHTSIHNIHDNCVMCHPTTVNGVKAPAVFKPFSLYEILLKLLRGLSWTN